ncbi:MAG: hypothetical protein L0H94_09845 [Nitrospira sp.]|nr:hypothetical protein [Nitrospira sp.]
MKKLAVVFMVATLSACATPYGEYGILGGFTDARIDENTFSISVDTNGLTSQQTTSMHALFRASELTVENGFDYFVIASDANNSTSMAMVMPGGSTSNTTINTYGSTAYGRTTTTYAPTTVVPVVYPNSTLIIKSFKGTKPEGVPNAYDARSVMKYIGPQIGVEQGTKP